MRFSRKLWIVATALFLFAMNGSPAKAQINSNTGTVTMNATLAESLTVTVNSGSTVNFTLAPNTAANAGSTSTGITTALALNPGRTAVAVGRYFIHAQSALFRPAAAIPLG